MKFKRLWTITLAIFFFLNSSNVLISANELKLREGKNFEVRVAQDVVNAFEEEEFVEILVELNEKAEIEDAVEESSKYLEKNTSAYEKKMLQRYTVVNALKESATTSQYSILKILDQEKEKGNVKDYSNFYIVNMIYVKCNKETLDILSKEKSIKSISIDSKIEIDLEPTIDETIVQEKSVVSMKDDTEWGIKKIEADTVWENYNIKGNGVVVGIIDSGFDWTHEAIKKNWRGYDPSNPTVPKSAGNWFDAVGGKEIPCEEKNLAHGTHVIGTIVGQDPEGKNTIGVAPGAQYIVARALTDKGGQDSWLLAAAEWMLAPDGNPALAPDIINNSWGGAPGLDEWYRDIVRAWRAAGILPIFAAGNEKGRPAPVGSISAPSNYPESFAVGATDINNARGIFSRRGPGPYANDVKPDIAAPGVGIKSSVPGGYEVWDGTSMAAPHISGVAALLLSTDPSLTPDQIEEIIIETATPIKDSDYNMVPNYGYGHGLVNALDAVAYITTGRGEINGKVLQKGEDVQAPVIDSHEVVKKGFDSLKIPLEVRVSDNISIKDVSAVVTNEGTGVITRVSLTRMSGNHKSAIFKGMIPSELVREGIMKYKIMATDFGGNVTETETYNVNVTFGEKPEEYTVDFTEIPEDWFLIDEGWQWGIPTGSPNKGDSDKVMATNLTGNYSKNMNEYLVTPLLDLREVDYAYITFDHFYETEEKYDKCIVAVTNNYGSTWTIIKEYSGTSNGWRSERVGLSEFVGSESPVLVAFILSTDASTHRLGWYIDNFSIKSVDNTAPEVPQNLKVSSTMVGPKLVWDVIADEELDFKNYNIYKSIGTQNVEYGELINTTVNSTYLDLYGVSEGTYNYLVKAIDDKGNESGASNVVTIEMPETESKYLSNFEFDNGDIMAGGTPDQWQWGNPTTGPKSAHSGKNLWATNLDGNYGNKINSWIQLPTINLDSTTKAAIGFNYWMQSENKYDKGYVEIKEELSDNWTGLKIYMGEKVQGEERWKNEVIDISDYMGKKIDIRFRFQSDSGGVREGWYIDDIKVAAINAESTSKTEAIEETESSCTPELILKYKLELAMDMEPFYDKVLEVEAYEEELWDKEKLEHEEKSQYTEEIEEEWADKKETEKEYREASEIVNRVLYYEGKQPYELQNMEDEISVSGIPVEAVVSIVETGKSTKTSLIDGTYRLQHPSNEEGENWTVRIASYGYKTILDKINIGRDQIITKDYKLEKIPLGKLQGTIIDHRTNKPISGAFVQVLEDPRLMPVVTDENGTFIVENIFTGEYTLKISHEEYKEREIAFQISDYEEENIIVELKTFVGYEHEIYYDDGKAEKGRTLPLSESGYGMRFTPEEYGVVKSVSISLYNNTWPSPGGNKFKVAIYDSNGDGNPGKLVIMTDVIEGVRGQWNEVNLSKYNFATDKDFYVFMLQDDIGTKSPGINMDESSSAGRSYVCDKGVINKLDASYGNTMIRAKIAYEVNSPVITSVESGSIIEADSILLAGKVNRDCEVKIIVKDEEKHIVTTQNKEFAMNIPLVEGENKIRVIGVINGKETEGSEVSIIRDTEAPIIRNISPEDFFETTRKKIVISGSVEEVNLSKILINNEEVSIGENNSYEHEVMLKVGENVITIKAIDKAGRETIKELKVICKESDIYSAEILSVTAGEELGALIINTEIKNISEFDISPTLIIMVTDEDYRVISISSKKISSLPSKKIVTLNERIKKPQDGSYRISVFVWDNIQDINPLAKSVEKVVEIKY